MKACPVCGGTGDELGQQNETGNWNPPCRDCDGLGMVEDDYEGDR